MKAKKILTILLWVVGGFLAFVFAINAGVYAASKPYIHSNVADSGVAQAALVSGAAIFLNGEISPVYKDRVKGAVALYNVKKVSKILVSGDNSTVWYNEVSPVRDYLVAQGIPDRDIFLDHAGFDTYSTMYRARNIFKVNSVIISTQSFHLPRSVFIARSLGMEAEGYRTDTGRTLFKNYVRELPANVKAVLNLITDREPKFLGEPIPMTEMVEWKEFDKRTAREVFPRLGLMF